MPGIVACTNCHARFAEGIKFCGRCGNHSFVLVSPGEKAENFFACPRCNAKWPQTSKFCGRCGLSINQTANYQVGHSGVNNSIFPTEPRSIERVCQRCGNTYPPNIKFCGRCGFNLQG